MARPKRQFTEEDKLIKAKFEISLWWRIKAACSVWWAIVVTKEIECVDD